MIRFPVLKDLQGGQKVMKVLGVAIDKRSGLILMGAFIGYSLFCYYLAKLVGLSPERAAIIFLPLLPFAFVFAFYRNRDGKHLDFVLWRKYLALVRPQVLLYKKRDPRNPEKPVRASVQEALPAEEFDWEMLRCEDGTYVVVFEVTPVSLSLVGDTERERVWYGNAALYNRADFPFVEITRTREGSTARYTRHLGGMIAGQVSPSETELYDFARGHMHYLERVVPSYNIFERKGYVILPYNAAREEAREQGASLGGLMDSLKSLFGGPAKKKGKPSKHDARKRQAEAEAAYRVLSIRAQVIHDGFRRMGCRIRPLTDLEFLSFIKGQTSEYDEDTDAVPQLYTPVMLETAGYQQLPEQRLAELIMEAEDIREEAPHALGIGDVKIKDKIAPDAVRVEPDHLRVEGRYHTTLYLSSWPDEATFGMLEDITHIEGRIKLVKYIEPRPKHEAIKILGGKLAELTASERTADDGNVASNQQRQISRFTNEQAMAELQSDRQKYFEISVLIHCEAKSEDALESIVQNVKTTLGGKNAEAKLAREEAWEGLLSCLPFGVNHLEPRYVSTGMMTNPLACLFSYGTHQIDHEHGIFLGVDTSSQSVMTLDTRELMNPHMVILGQTGAGKSQTVKAITTRLRMLGHRVILIDPVGNSKYSRVVKQVGGEFVYISPSSRHKINPFALHENYLNMDLMKDTLEDGDSEEDAEAMAREAAYDGKVQEIVRMISLMISADDGSGEGLDPGEAGYVEEAVYEAYNRKGVTQDPATHHLEPPVLPDLFAVLREQEGTNPGLTQILKKLYSWEKGGLSKLFNAQTNVNLENKYLCFQIANVKDRQKAPVMHAILEFMNGILSNPAEPSDCFIDEAWSLLSYEMSADFAETMWRSGRARNSAMCAISQQVAEFVESFQGKRMLELSATHMIFRHQNHMSCQATGQVYDLSPEETEGLKHLQPGQGYLVVEENRIPMEILCSPHEMRLYNTDPSLEAEYVEQERLEAEAEAHGRADPSPVSTGSPSRTETANPLDALPDREARPADVGKPEPTRTARSSSGYKHRGKDRAADPADPAEMDTAELDLRELQGTSGEDPEYTDEPMRIYALCGAAAHVAAAAVAREIARDAEDEERYILAVDACGGELAAQLCEPIDLNPVDDYLVNGSADPEALGPYMAVSHSSDHLMIAAPPDDGNLPGFSLITAAREAFDVCVVACSDESYAADWLGEADEVIACSWTDTKEALAAALSAEEWRGKNGTRIATIGGSAEEEVIQGLGDRPTFSFGADLETLEDLDDATQQNANELVRLVRSLTTEAGREPVSAVPAGAAAADKTAPAKQSETGGAKE